MSQLFNFHSKVMEGNVESYLRKNLKLIERIKKFLRTLFNSFLVPTDWRLLS